MRTPPFLIALFVGWNILKQTGTTKIKRNNLGGKK